MRKWIYTNLGHLGTVTTTVDGETIELESGTEMYVASEVDAMLKRQAAAAINGINAATAISSGQLQQAHRLRAESNPEALESERAANALLTARVEELERRLIRINAINDNPAIYNSEINELSTL
jgi:hypothetical protein